MSRGSPYDQYKTSYYTKHNHKAYCCNNLKKNKKNLSFLKGFFVPRTGLEPVIPP